MKLSVNFLKDYIDVETDVKTLAEDMTRVGNEYDQAEKLINVTNLTIGKLIEDDIKHKIDNDFIEKSLQVYADCVTINMY